VTSPTVGLLSDWPASETRGAAPKRLCRNTIDVTPVAATSSTEISPMVSQARISTSSTLTVLAPCPRKYAASGSNSAIGVPVRAAIAYTANVVTVAPTASARRGAAGTD
jgi:hypothetical protein